MQNQNKIIEDFIDTLTHDQLKYVLKNFLEISPDFINYANSLVKTNDIDALYDKIKTDIYIIIQEHTYRKFIDWRACMDACNELENLMEFHIETILSGKPLTALKILLEFYKTGIYLAENADDSGGGVSSLMSHTEQYLQELVASIKEAATTQDKSKCYALLIKAATSKHYEGWSDAMFTLLGLSIPLSTKTNIGKLTSVLDDLSQKQCKYGADYYIEQITLLRVRIIEHLHGRQTAYEKILTEYQADSTLLLAFTWCYEDNDFNEALKITEIALSSDKTLYRRKDAWLNRQLDIYTKLKNKEGILKCSKELLFSGNIEAYATYKKMLQQIGTWEKEKPQLLLQLAKCMRIDNYLHILDNEKEYDAMLRIITKNHYYIRHYAKKLFPHNPKETTKLYQEYILSQANAAINRNQYKKVCDHLKEYAKICGKDAGLDLATTLLLTFRRKPAFVEEISFVHKRLVGLK